MNKQSFEQNLLHGIPLSDAVGFFHRIKHADWADPPDVTGALEGQFIAPLEQVVLKLTEVTAAKFKLMLAYHVYAESMRGVAQHACAEVFHEHAEQERAAAEAYLKRAAALGSGPVHMPEVEAPPASADPVGILQIMARAEQEGIAAQHELKEMVGEQNPLAFQIEQYMIEDQHHLDELWQMMPQEAQPLAVPEPSAAISDAPPAEPPPAEGKPVTKEAADLMSLRQAVSSGGRRAASAAGEAAAKASGKWHTFNRLNKPGITGGQIAGLAGAGGLLGAVRQSGQVASMSPEEKQEMLESQGPVGRFAVRHPGVYGGLSGAVGAGALGAGYNRVLQGLDLKGLAESGLGQNATPAQMAKFLSQKHLLQGAGIALAPIAAGVAAQAVDSSKHQQELEELAKGASAVADRLRKELSPMGRAHAAATAKAVREAAPKLKDTVKGSLKAVGDKIRAGVRRSGELLTGSKASRYAMKSQKEMIHGAEAAHSGLRASGLQLSPGEKAEYVKSFQKHMKRSKRIGGLAEKEYRKVRATQLGTAGVVGGGTLALTHKKNKKDFEKVDRTNERLKRAFAEGLAKIGFSGPVDPNQSNDPGAAPMPGAEQSVMPQPSMAAPGPQPPMAQPPGSQQYAPVNYLEAEETARRAQAANEAEFYKSKAEEAGMASQGMQAQMQDLQTQMEQLQTQAAESQNQIMTANNEAVTANDQMLNQATLAARMRMGMQQLRAQMMEIASQDPEQLATAAGGPTPMDVGSQAQAAAAGAAPAPTGLNGETEVTGESGAAPGSPNTPGASPSAGAPPGSAPGGAGAPSGGGEEAAPEEPQKSDSGGKDEKKDSAETTVSIKKGSPMGEIGSSMRQELLERAPYMAAGAGLGALVTGLSAKKGKEIPTLRQKVDELKGQQDGGFGKSIELAKAQMALGQAEEDRSNPLKASLKGGLMGAAAGGAVPDIISGGRRLMGNLSAVKQNL